MSVLIEPEWTTASDRVLLHTRVDVHNDGGRTLRMVAFDARHPDTWSSLIGMRVLPPGRRLSPNEAAVIRWSELVDATAQLIDEDAELAAGDTWQASYLFDAPADAAAARVVVRLHVREIEKLWRGAAPTQEIQADTIVIRPKEGE